MHFNYCHQVTAHLQLNILLLLLLNKADPSPPCEVTHLLPLNAFMACTWTTLPLFSVFSYAS